MRSSLFLAARAVVNDEDPLGLIELGAPEYEYDPDIEDLLRWSAVVGPQRVIEVFVKWCGDSGRMPADMAERIAHGIESARGPGTAGRS